MLPSKGRRASNPPVLLAGLLLAVTLLAGMVVGGALDRMILVRQHRLLPREGLRFVSSRVVKRLDHELGLTAEQKTAVTAILEKHRLAVEGAWKEVQPRMRQEMDRANVEIEKILTPDQKKKFSELRQRWNRRARHFTDPAGD